MGKFKAENLKQEYKNEIQLNKYWRNEEATLRTTQ